MINHSHPRALSPLVPAAVPPFGAKITLAASCYSANVRPPLVCVNTRIFRRALRFPSRNKSYDALTDRAPWMPKQGLYSRADSTYGFQTLEEKYEPER